MEIMDDQKCFVCGSKSKIGLKAKFDQDKIQHTASAKLVLDEKYQGWQGIIHGGIIGALLDEVCFYACCGVSMKMVTAELNIRYKNPLHTGAEVVVFGKMVDQKRNILNVEAKLESEGKVIALATAKMFVLDYQKV